MTPAEGPGTVWPRVAAGVAALLGVPLVVVLLIAAAFLGAPPPGSAAPTTDGTFAAGREAERDIPPAYLRLYQHAAEAYGVEWSILAAIGKVETDHGRSLEPGVRSGVNTLGCCGGPMQFWIAPPHPNTWDTYRVDGDHDGRTDPYDPADAIPAAARYLVANGAPANYRAAIFAYNHASWYVEDVLRQADRYRGQPTSLQALDPGSGSRLARVIALADQIDTARIPYCYGGGHNHTPAIPSRGSYCWQTDPERKDYSSPDPGLDCSSAVSLLLQHAGYHLPTMTSGQLAGWGLPGPGAHVTIWANADHVFLQIDERMWGTSDSNYRHGPGWHPLRPTDGFIARHPPGL